MSYVYANVDSLQGTDLVGSHQCVALVQHYASAPVTSRWKAGIKVKGDTSIKKGTAIATFVNGRYPNNAHNNHAALYISQDGAGIWVMDQWKGDPNKPSVSKRRLNFKGTLKSGAYIDPSNNGDAFFVIE